MDTESKITLSETERNILKELYEDGMNIETKELFYQNGEYKDCIYILKD